MSRMDYSQSDVNAAAKTFAKDAAPKAGKAEAQFATVANGDPSGGNTSGGNQKQPNVYISPAFMGKSGQPNNQNTSRPKGST